MKIFATYNIKGGVGKTSAAVNLAYLAGRDGYRTLLWDLDPQGAASFMFRVRPRVKGGAKALIRGSRPLDEAIKGTDFDGLDLLPADFTYRNMDLALHKQKRPTRQLARLLDPLAQEYDIVFLDCPPSISLVSENILHAVDTLLVPVIPTTLSQRTFDQLTSFIETLDGDRPAVLAFFSMVDRRKRLHREIVAALPAERSDIARAAIPALTQVEQMAVRRAPVAVFAPRSAAAQAYAELWGELRARAGLGELAGLA
jgi:chromosome partitioning protein